MYIYLYDQFFISATNINTYKVPLRKLFTSITNLIFLNFASKNSKIIVQKPTANEF